MMGSFTRGFYNISEWIMRLAYVNILWIFFSIVGLLIFGFFPATTAMFAVVRQWVRGKTDVSVFKTFWISYKSEFIKSNLIGLVMFIIGYVIYFNLTIIKASTIPLLDLLYIPQIIITFLYVLTLLYIFPVLVHFNVRFIDVIKNAFILMTANPMVTFSKVVLTGLLCFVFMKFPGVIPFFSGSLIACLLMWLSNHTFVKLSKLQG